MRSVAGTPIELGKILTGRDSREKEGTGYVRLPEWPQSVSISERDPETTYIRSLRVVCFSRSEGIVGIDAVADRERDNGPYWTLRRGHALKAEVSGRAIGDCIELALEVRGYYVPLE